MASTSFTIEDTQSDDIQLPSEFSIPSQAENSILELYTNTETVTDQPRITVETTSQVSNLTKRVPTRLISISNKSKGNTDSLEKSSIPLRTNSAGRPKTQLVKSGTYSRPTGPSNLPILNRGTLEANFSKNKKRLAQMHEELVEKQRPLQDLYKTLVRTKKQLKDLGKDVKLDDLKFVSLNTMEATILKEGGDDVDKGIAVDLKSSMENLVNSFKELCRNCLDKRIDAVKKLEELTKPDGGDEEKMDTLRQENIELSKTLEVAIEQCDKKLEEISSKWQNYASNRGDSKEILTKMAEMEEKLKQQTRIITETEQRLEYYKVKVEEKKASQEKSEAEYNEKINKLEEDIKKEKKTSQDTASLIRKLRMKNGELDKVNKDLNQKITETNNAINQIKEKSKLLEEEWNKEKEILQKNEAFLQKKYKEKQTLNSQMNARLRAVEDGKKTDEETLEKTVQILEKKLEGSTHTIEMLEKSNNMHKDRNKELEEKIVDFEANVKDLSEKLEAALKEDTESAHGIEMLKYKKKIAQMQETVKTQTSQIKNMQNSLKRQTQLAVDLKVERDTVMQHSDKLRNVLASARDDIESKGKMISKVYDLLNEKESECESMRWKLNEMRSMGASNR